MYLYINLLSCFQFLSDFLLLANLIETMQFPLHFYLFSNGYPYQTFFLYTLPVLAFFGGTCSARSLRILSSMFLIIKSFLSRCRCLRTLKFEGLVPLSSCADCLESFQSKGNHNCCQI
jgi:hypothetical protein